MDNTNVVNPAAKAATAVGAAVGTAGLSLADWSMIATIAAGALASAYSLLLIADFFWKRFVKPFAIRRGWIKRQVWVPGDDAE